MENVLSRTLPAAASRRLNPYLAVFAAFACGFGAAFLLLSKPRAQPVTSPSTDYYVTLPQGETTVTITDPLADPEQLAKFTVVRRGDVVTGVPVVERRVAPRPRLSPEDAAFFRRELRGVLSPSDSAWRRANKIREWLAAMSKRQDMPGLASRVPRDAYERMRRGESVLCGNLAEIYAALCEAAGLTARVVGMTILVRDGRLGRDAHGAAEVWVPEMGEWVYEDPTFDCYWLVEGKPAGALALHDALMEGREIAPAPEALRRETASKNYLDPRLYFRHLTYEYRAGGDLIYYADPRLEPLNLRDRNWMQTDEREVFERLDADGNTLVERRSEVAPGIYVQLLGDKLFVRDRRAGGRGVRVRSSTGVVHVCAYERLDAEGLGLFSGVNLIAGGQAGSALLAPASDWSASGPVEVLRSDGWQGLAAAPGGKLRRRLSVRAGGSYILYAEVNAARGRLRWSVGDAPLGTESSGEVEAGRISEVISDVVQSRSGELEVSFALPDGGGFRVLNVLVVEAPTFAAGRPLPMPRP
jgi:Transglutaminase-like superfamily